MRPYRPGKKIYDTIWGQEDVKSLPDEMSSECEGPQT